MKVPLHRWPEAAVTVARTWGARGAALRAIHEVRRSRSGFRPGPRHAPGAAPSPAGDPFRVDAARLRAATDREGAVARAERVRNGFHHAYRWDWRPLPADAAGWHVHPLTGKPFPTGLPWWRVPHLHPELGDIKDVWEPGRFAWVYDLVRGYLVTGDERYADAFHERLAQWHESSPPFQGVHWSCGQETAIRATALLYADANLPARGTLLREVLAASGERIADAIGYALSQRNNHGISEAVGLVLVGSRLAGAHPEAGRWAESGRRHVEALVREQFAEDGWYIQHSFTYLRLAVEQCVLAQRALRARGQTLSAPAVARIRAAVELLLGVIEPGTGIVPNHGANDGALVHPTTLAEYRDFRPVLTAACAVFGFPLPAGVGADAETLAWLGAAPPQAGEPLRDGVRSGPSGWASARVGGACVFLRAGRYTSRPQHLDPLHLDVRFGAREVVVDPGSYLYNGPPPWRNGLAGARFHNGPLLDDREPGVRGPRFLWYLWPAADLLRAEMEGGQAVLVAEVPGQVRREVRAGADGVVVTDRVLRPDARSASVRWTLHPDADPASVRVEGPSQLREAREGEPAGWVSLHYGERTASRVVDARREPPEALQVVTVIAPGP